MAFVSKKIILAKTQYKTHDLDLLTLVKYFKIWHHYLEIYKCQVIVIINLNNL